MEGIGKRRQRLTTRGKAGRIPGRVGENIGNRPSLASRFPSPKHETTCRSCFVAPKSIADCTAELANVERVLAYEFAVRMKPRPVRSGRKAFYFGDRLFSRPLHRNSCYCLAG